MAILAMSSTAARPGVCGGTDMGKMPMLLTGKMPVLLTRGTRVLRQEPRRKSVQGV